ncbi:hypothetical protein BH18GEM1_BH18GEM1_08640 [soil metagenome]
MRSPAIRVLLPVAVLAMSACASRQVRPWQYTPRPLADTLAIWEPEEREVPIVYDAAHEFVIDPTIDILNVPGWFIESPPALNADPMDGVVNSTWFTNRNAVDPLTPDEVMRGSHTGEGPDDSAPLEITDNKSEGVNVGFWINDAAGQRWIIKLDPPEFPEMGSGADVLATNLVWAAGYNTPENYVYSFDPNNIVLEEEFEIEVFEDGETVNYEVGADEPDERELTVEKFRQAVLEDVPRQPDGTIRTLASKFLPGTPKGPFAWEGRRPDDPNDVVPHEHRRELRGYYVVGAWLNQTDTKQGNTLDMFILDEGSPEDDENARRFGYLRHYMLDNGSALGSGGTHPQDPRHGSENELDMDAIGKRFLTLGLYERPWQDVDEEDAQNPPSIGYYQSEIFLPGDWRPNIPNEAFNNIGPRDGYWGAKIVMSFTDEQLERAIDATQWSDVAARTYLLRSLKERRDMTGRYWFSRVSPLDNPWVEDRAIVVFDDRWTRHFGGTTEYRVEFDWAAPEPEIEFQGVFTEPRITLPMPAGAVAQAERPRDRYALLQVWKRQEDGDWAPRPARFWLDWQNGSYRVIGARY